MAMKSQLKKAYGDCMGPLGVPMKSNAAKELEELIKTLPQECREAGLKHVNVFSKKQEFDSEERTDVSIVTNDAIDRDNEVIIAKGLDWKQWKRAGMPVTFAHDYSALPIGRGVGVWKYRSDAKDVQAGSREGWKAMTKYASRPDGWEGQWLPDAIVSLIDQRMLSGKSIGFIPTEFSSPKPEEIKSRPELADVNFIIRKATVIEYAVAPIQSNPEAIISGTKGFNKDLTDRALEHLGIILPSSEDYDYFEKELDKESDIKYKVITQASMSERILKALRSR